MQDTVILDPSGGAQHDRPEIVEETMEKIKSVGDKMRATHDRQKNYAEK